MSENNFDVIVIGAGAAGLMAAYELCMAGKKVAIIEARNRIGGRIHTIQDPNFSMPPELGAEFIHGNLKQTLLLLKKAKIEYYKLTGDMYRAANGKIKKAEDFIENYAELNKKFKEINYDISIAAFFNEYLKEERFANLRQSLKGYVEGYYAGDIYTTSTFALRDELNSSEEAQYRIEGGYIRLIEFLMGECKQRSGSVFLSSPVKHILWQKNKVTVSAKEKEWTGQKIIITVPLGTLQSAGNSESYIHFSPAIPDTISAAKELGYGAVIKFLLQFTDSFWNGADNRKLGFVFSDEIIPTWWTQLPKDYPIMTGWLAGPKADKLKHSLEDELLQIALTSLANIFTTDIHTIKEKLQAFHIINWAADPYSCGGYSFKTVSGALFRNIVKTPVDQTLFFAGEALHDGPENGTVEGALCNGRETAERVIAGF